MPTAPLRGSPCLADHGRIRSVGVSRLAVQSQALGGRLEPAAIVTHVPPRVARAEIGVGERQTKRTIVATPPGSWRAQWPSSKVCTASRSFPVSACTVAIAAVHDELFGARVDVVRRLRIASSRSGSAF